MDQIDTINQVIENHILVWSGTSSFSALADILERDRKTVADRICRLIERSCNKIQPQSDEVRTFLLRYALERVKAKIDLGHFVLFKENETVRVVLEDAFGVEPGIDDDIVIIPHQNLALRVIAGCLFAKRGLKSIDEKDVVSFMQLFGGVKAQTRPDQDRTMRFKSLVWLVYLAIELARVDERVFEKGLEYFRNKFRELLDRAIDGSIIDADPLTPRYDGGKWEGTLFAWLQGQDRKQFALKLKRQFNFENRMEHANRFLLAEHRKCAFEQVMAFYCRV